MTDPISAWQGKHVLVLGDVMLDRTTHMAFVKPSPEVEGVSVYREGDVTECDGGAGNVAANIRSLGGNATLVGRVHGHIAIKHRYMVDGKQIMRIDNDPKEPLTPREVDVVLSHFSDTLPDADIVVLSDYAKGILCDDVLIPAIKMAKAAGKRMIVDPKRHVWDAYEGASVITPNWHEWTSAHTVQPSFDGTVITQGPDGLLVWEKNRGGETIRGHAVENPDGCGAGDTVVAALALGLCAGLDLYEAAKIANVAASIAVSKPGTATVAADELRTKL